MKKLALWEASLYRSLRGPAGKCTPILLCLLHVIAFGKIFFLQNAKVTNYFLVFEFLCILFLFALHYRILRPIWLMVLLGLNVIFLSVTLYLHGGYGLALVYVGIILFLLMTQYFSISRRAYVLLHVMMAIFLTYLLGVMSKNYNNPFLNLFGMDFNPNMYGILALFCTLYWVCAFSQMKLKTGYRLLGQWCGVILGGTYVLYSGCRSALLAFMAFMLLWAIIRRPLPARLRWGMLTLLAVGCLAFVFLYVDLSHHIENIRIFSKTMFSGREDIWEVALADLKENFLLGGNATEWDLSMHNTMLQLWYKIGLIPMLTLMILLGYSCSTPVNATVNKTAQAALIACLCITLFESSLVDPSLYVFFLSFMLTNIKSEGEGTVTQ